MAKGNPKALQLNQIHIDAGRFAHRGRGVPIGNPPRFQHCAESNDETVGKLLGVLAEGELLPPIRVWYDPAAQAWYVVDGHARREAYRLASLMTHTLWEYPIGTVPPSSSKRKIYPQGRRIPVEAVEAETAVEAADAVVYDNAHSPRPFLPEMLDESLWRRVVTGGLDAEAAAAKAEQYGVDPERGQSMAELRDAKDYGDNTSGLPFYRVAVGEVEPPKKRRTKTEPFEPKDQHPAFREQLPDNWPKVYPNGDAPAGGGKNETQADEPNLEEDANEDAFRSIMDRLPPNGHKRRSR